MEERLKQLLALAREHYEKREFDRAEPHLRQILEHTRQFADVFNMLGVILHDQGKFADAQESFEEALRLNPRYTEAALNLAVTYNDLGKYGEAKRVYSAALAASREQPEQLDPFVRGKIANMHAEIAAAYADAGLPRDAVVEYRKAMTLCPEFSDIRVRLGSLYRDLGDLESALQEFTEAKRFRPRFSPARVQIGITLLALGRRDDAVAEWKALLDFDPDNRAAAMYLRMVRTTEGPEPG
jgi:tetratricopeptide (TPR) repeat protein